MDRKSIIILVACIALIFLWDPIVVKKLLYPPKPLPPGQTNLVVKAERTNASTPVPQQTTPVPAEPAPPAAPASVLNVNTNTTEDLVEVRNGDIIYTFSSYGGGLKSVDLFKSKPKLATSLNSHAKVSAMAVLGGEALEGDGIFKLSRTENGVRAEKTLTNGLSIVKDFTPGSNYLLTVSVRLENQSDAALSLPPQHWVTGTATPLTPRDDGSTVGVMWYNGDAAKTINAGWFANKTLGCVPGTPRWQYVDGQSNVFWAAAFNQFFALAAMTREPAQQIEVNKITLPAPSPESIRADSRLNRSPLGYQAAMVYPAATLPPKGSMKREFSVFAGPKEYRVLATIAARAKNNIDSVMGFGGFFGFFSKGLLLGMNWLHDNLRLSYGWAIIAITIVIKMLFWPLTRASTRSMKRMQALQPQMKAIQEKYKDDPVKMNRKTMEFMKQNKVSPLGGCLPMLLQMPVFIGFFYMIRSAIELRGASWFWVSDLSMPDTLFMIPGINFPFNLLPLIMGVTMLWQAHLTPPSPGMDPMQAKIMKYMPLIFMVFLYNFSAGLTLYWTVQNLLTILQTKLTKEKATEPVAPAPVVAAPQKQRKRK